MASAGYPESASKGDVITGTEQLDARPDVDVIHAGTEARDGSLLTHGGRVLAVTAVGGDVSEARTRAYEGIAAISFEGAQWRTDIAASMEDPGPRPPADQEEPS
jgi:phosphoribosylamine--glycine ligase